MLFLISVIRLLARPEYDSENPLGIGPLTYCSASSSIFFGGKYIPPFEKIWMAAARSFRTSSKRWRRRGRSSMFFKFERNTPRAAPSSIACAAPCPWTTIQASELSAQYIGRWNNYVEAWDVQHLQLTRLCLLSMKKLVCGKTVSRPWHHLPAWRKLSMVWQMMNN